MDNILTDIFGIITRFLTIPGRISIQIIRASNAILFSDQETVSLYRVGISSLNWFIVMTMIFYTKLKFMVG